MTLHLPDWQTRQAQLRANALSFLDSTQSTSEALAAISNAIGELAGSGLEIEKPDFFRTEGIREIASRLRARELPQWASALEKWCGGNDQAEEVDRSAVEILVGRASGDLCGRNPRDQEFIFVRRLREVIPFRSADFLAAAEGALKANSGAESVLATMLRQRAADFPTNPGRVAHIMDRGLPELSGEQPQHLRLVDVWDGPVQRALIWLRDSDAYELLRRVNRTAYLDLLEGFPLRGAIYELLEAANAHATTSELCLLLRDALPVFGSGGEWIRENQVAFVVLNLLGERLLRHASADAEPTDAFQATLVELLEALTKRSDLVPLGYAWFQHLLMSGGRSRRRGAVLNDGDAGAALLRVATALAAYLPPHSAPIEWVAEEQYVWRNNRTYTLLTIEICRASPDIAAITTLIEQVVSKDLVSTVAIDRLLSDPKCLERQVIANSIARIPDVASWFRDLWERLFWQRDRARSFRHTDRQLPNVGQVIAVWTVCGLELLDAGSDQSRALWIELESAIRESSLTDAFRQHNDAWSQTLRFLAGVWLRTFPDDPPTGTRGALEDFIGPWIRIDAGFALLAVILNRYGVQPERLRGAGISGDILCLIVEDAALRARSILNEQEIVAVKSLADKLDANSRPLTSP